MKRKGMSCQTLPTSMISGVICYWSPPGLLNLLSKVNLVFLVDLAFPCIYLKWSSVIWSHEHHFPSQRLVRNILHIKFIKRQPTSNRVAHQVQRETAHKQQSCNFLLSLVSLYLRNKNHVRD
jgi:hypothetical protein